MSCKIKAKSWVGCYSENVDFVFTTDLISGIEPKTQLTSGQWNRKCKNACFWLLGFNPAVFYYFYVFVSILIFYSYPSIADGVCEQWPS